MPEARSCPHCGAPIPVEATSPIEDQAAPIAFGTIQEADLEKDLDLPSVPLLAPGSQDDNFFGTSSGSRIVPALPDPILGEFVTPTSGSSPSTLLEEPPRDGPVESFPAIDLGAKFMKGPAHSPSKPEEDEAEGVEEFEPEGRRTSWATVLLTSYASAITLGLVWTLMKDRSKEKPEPATNRPSVVATPESARQAGLSRKVEPPEPILGEHFATMGKPLRVGDLDVTPVEVRRQTVTLLRSTFAKPDRKTGGKDAMVLRLRLKNTSKDTVFAPLDQAYLRERGKEIVDTFIETADGDRIYPYLLAIESEWSIAGQDFEELRPGESREVAIVSTPEAPPDSLGPFTWRVRLRTGINRTDLIGLRWPAK